MARRAAVAEFIPDALDEAVQVDRQNTADVLTDALESLSGFDQSSIRGILYRIPVPNGKYEWIRDVYPPFDVSEIMRSLKEEVGGGDFALRLMAENKPRKTLHFSIMREPKSVLAPATQGNDMFMMMMQMQQENSRQAQASADRMMQMMMGNSQQMTTVLVAAMSNREKAADFLPLLAALKGDEPKKDSLKDTVETIAAIKGLFPNGDASGLGSLDAEGLIDGALKLAGPVAGAIGKAMEARRERLNGTQPAEEAPPTGLEPAPRPLMLARPAALEASQGSPAPVGKFPVLNAIRPDIAYFFSRRHDPELAAEAVVSILADVPGAEEMVNELVASFAISPDWKADLAAEGIDLRADPQWADQFLSALVAEWSDPERDADDLDRGGGDAADVEDHGAVRTAGVNGHAGAEPSGGADN